MGKRRWEKREYGGIPFEYDLKGSGMVNPRYTLDSAYGRPSRAKEAIYNEWWNDALRLGELTEGGRREVYDSFGIPSFNCMQFTVAFRFVEPETGEIMQAYITKSHNYLWSV